MKNKLLIITLLFFIIFLKTQFLEAKSPEGHYENMLKDVYFLNEPFSRLIFEFELKPKYEIQYENQKIILKLQNVKIKNTNWLKSLPKDIIREFNIYYENKDLVINLLCQKNFNFKASTFENKLIIDFIFTETSKPISISIKDKKIELLERKEKIDIESLIIPSDSRYPEYEIYIGEQKIKMPMVAKEYKGFPISVDFQEADIHAVLRFIAEVGGINIVTSDQVKGSVTLKAKNVPWDLLFDTILATKGLAKLSVGNIIRVGSLEEIKKEAELYKDYWRAKADTKEGVKREIENQRDILKAIQETQEKSNLLITQTFQLKYLRASKVIDILKNQRISEKLLEILTDPNKLTFDPLSNVIIVKGTPKILEEIEKIIKEIDKPRAQILIEARIVEISDTYKHQLGIKWGGTAYKGTEHTIFGVGSVPSTTTNPITYTYQGGYSPGNSTINVSFPSEALVDLGIAGSTNIGIVFGHIGKSVTLLDVQLSALEQQGVARIISKPRILTMDREPATIQQGFKIPYLSYAQNIQQATVTFIDAGLKFNITPSLTPEGKLFLDIYIEKSYPDWSHTVQGVPTIVTNILQTSSFVDSGETLAIGGIRISDIEESLDKVPGLANLPGLGEAFKRRGKLMNKSELIVFITPKIIYTPVPGVDF